MAFTQELFFYRRAVLVSRVNDFRFASEENFYSSELLITRLTLSV
jgi:hypothetical protein